MADGGDTNNERDIARDVFWRYWQVWDRGFEEWRLHVARLEEYYLGGGRQWRKSDRAALEDEGRPAHEVNIVMQAVNTAAGYQIANRVDVSYLPRGGEADEHIAKVLGKVSKYAMDRAQYRYHETDAFLDGLIQQRGFIDVRMDYSESTLGEIAIEALDPLDCLPDPDAKSYDPDGWTDFRSRRWLTAREIEGKYGEAAAQAVVDASVSYCDLTVFGDHLDQEQGFAGTMPPSYARNFAWYEDTPGKRRYCIIDQQTNEFMQALTAVWPTGEMRVVEGASREQLAWLIDHGVQVIKRRMRRVRWEVCAPEVTLVNKVSPYDHITTTGYFPYFRRGKTVGMVDNMVSPQDMLNKFISQFATVVNASANGGWQGQAESLANMTDDEFVNRASESSLILLRKTGKEPFEKIKPNQIPAGLDKMIEFAHAHGKVASGVDENLSGAKADPGMSGVAYQSLQYASQQKLAIALDNLSRTRRIVHTRALECMQKFMGNERIIRIGEADEFGIERHVPLALNQIQDDGRVLNDLTIGQYSVAINERPAKVTFDNSEFEQLTTMRKDMAIPIPDATIVRASNLADKSEIAEALQQAASQPPPPNPEQEANIALANAKAKLAEAQAVTASITAQYEAIQTATAIVVTPQSAALADALLKSGGYVDHDAPPIVPNAPAGIAPPPPGALPHNTHPLHPANADMGAEHGLTDGPTQPPV